jgi:hypothetical protein
MPRPEIMLRGLWTVTARSAGWPRTPCSEGVTRFSAPTGQIVVVDVEGANPDAPEGSRSADDKARFTFRGEPKPVGFQNPVTAAEAGF